MQSNFNVHSVYKFHEISFILSLYSSIKKEILTTFSLFSKNKLQTNFLNSRLDSTNRVEKGRFARNRNWNCALPDWQVLWIIMHARVLVTAIRLICLRRIRSVVRCSWINSNYKKCINAVQMRFATYSARLLIMARWCFRWLQLLNQIRV